MSTTAVRVFNITNAMINHLQVRINKLRSKNNLTPFNKMQTIDFLVRNAKIEEAIK